MPTKPSALTSKRTSLYGYIQHGLTHLIYLLSHCTTPWVRTGLIKGFLAAFPTTNLSEAESDKIEHYPSFNAFFTRQLKADARPLADNDWVCPADGKLMEVGQADADRILQAKKHPYTLTNLLGDPDIAERFASSQFATTYLAPFNYHRVHCPCDAQLTDMLLIPGMLHSVKPGNIHNLPQLYTRNERLVMCFDTAQGPMAVVMIGALLVGSIETAWAGVVNHPRHITVTHTHYDKPLVFKRGQTLGHFHYGSCVVWLGPASLQLTVEAPNTVQFGQSLASIGHGTT